MSCCHIAPILRANPMLGRAQSVCVSCVLMCVCDSSLVDLRSSLVDLSTSRLRISFLEKSFVDQENSVAMCLAMSRRAGEQPSSRAVDQ